MSACNSTSSRINESFTKLRIQQIRRIQQYLLIGTQSAGQGKARGISLIEIIVSVGLLSLLVFGALTLVPRGLSQAKRAEYTTAAVNVAQAQLETLLARDYQTLPAGVYESRTRLSSNPADYLYALERQTQITLVRISDLASTAVDEGLKRITVTVFYPTAFGERSVVFSSLIARR